MQRRPAIETVNANRGEGEHPSGAVSVDCACTPPPPVELLRVPAAGAPGFRSRSFVMGQHGLLHKALVGPMSSRLGSTLSSMPEPARTRGNALTPAGVVLPCVAARGSSRIAELDGYSILVEEEAARNAFGSADASGYEAVARGLANQMYYALLEYAEGGYESAALQVVGEYAITVVRERNRLFRLVTYNASASRGLIAQLRASRIAARYARGALAAASAEVSPTTVALTTSNETIFFIHAGEGPRSELRAASRGDTPLCRHEAFHLVANGYAPSLSAAVAPRNQDGAESVGGYLRWLTEGMAAAGAAWQILGLASPGPGLRPRDVRDLQSRFPDEFPHRGWSGRLDGPFSRSREAESRRSVDVAYARGAFFLCAHVGSIGYLKGILCATQAWLDSNNGPQRLARLERGDLLRHIMQTVDASGVPEFRPGLTPNRSLTGFDAAFARTVFWVGRYRGNGIDGESDRAGVPLYSVGDRVTIGGEQSDSLPPASSVGRAYFPTPGKEARRYRVSLDVDRKPWPEGFALIGTVKRGDDGQDHDDERRVFVLRQPGEQYEIPLQGVTAQNPLQLNIINLSRPDGVNVPRAVPFAASLRVV